MRFTASKEAGNPHADLVGIALETLLVMIVKHAEMLAQLARNHVFLQLLPAVLVVGLHDLDHAVDRTIDVLQEHILQFHLRFSSPVRPD